GTRDLTDAVGTLEYLFRGGPAPVTVTPRRGLPTAGVTTCRGDAGPIACPAPGGRFYGQDANYPALAHDFELVKPDPNAESTWYTIDHATGLVWQYEHSRERMTWPEAVSYANALELAGFAWRLPNAY